ncbi:MAG: SIS domain-containing protein [Candidatus Calescibacterium sp.]|nr:SIS domain-containing protein [Candidatus Calescibacterium sp.]MCX7972448.1 SIS domain-containing protein [bacterium]MDW8195661.1 SIS domain-containing protein [Candidatus Calescibacterium sp.]
MINSIRSIILESISLKNALLQDEEVISQILKAISIIVSAIRSGKKVMIAGNGGSAADSQHMAAELVGRLNLDRKPLPAIALTTDTSIITSISNDFDFSQIFARQIRAIGNPGDILMLISTSGNSKNLIKAVEESKIRGIITIGLLGRDGGTLAQIVDIPIIVKHNNTQRIQESQLMIEHIICELVEQQLQEYI